MQIQKTVLILYTLTQSPGHDVDLDISLAHPWSLDTIRRAGEKNGCAASKREEKKLEKYNHEVLLDGSKPFLIPLCLSTLGGGASLVNWQRSLGPKEGPRMEQSFGQIGDHVCLSPYRNATVR